MRIVKVDFHNQQQGEDLVYMLGQYALDEHVGGKRLTDYTQQNLMRALQETPIAVSFIAYIVEEPVGLINCIQGFSTFKARPLLNIHGLIIRDGYRGQGIGTQLLARAEEEARSRECCKVSWKFLNRMRVRKRYIRKLVLKGTTLEITLIMPSFGKKNWLVSNQFFCLISIFCFDFNVIDSLFYS